MTRGNQRNANRDKAMKKKAGKNIQANNKVGKAKKPDAQQQQLKYLIIEK